MIILRWSISDRFFSVSIPLDKLYSRELQGYHRATNLSVPLGEMKILLPTHIFDPYRYTYANSIYTGLLRQTEIKGFY